MMEEHQELYLEHLSHALVLRSLWLSGETRVGNLSQSGKLPDRMLQRMLERMYLTSPLVLSSTPWSPRAVTSGLIFYGRFGLR
jgi:hypothetical protein